MIAALLLVAALEAGAASSELFEPAAVDTTTVAFVESFLKTPTNRLSSDQIEAFMGVEAVGGLAEPLADVKVEWVAPHGTPGIVAVQFQTANGLVRI